MSKSENLILLDRVHCNLIGAVDLLEHIPVCHLSSFDAKCMSDTVFQVAMQLENTMSELDNFILSWTEYSVSV